MQLSSKKLVEVRYNTDMLSDSIPPATLVTTKADLRTLASTLSQQPLIAVDTEANSLFAYKERVCLIQFSIPSSDYLVDPLAIDDLSPLGVIFQDPTIEKIFHAAEYDIIILQHDYNFIFERLFDTMVAARILGWKSVGLSAILKTYFDVNVNKKYQRADWGRRPIQTEMLSYAQLDTHYLIPLREKMKAQLKARNRWELAKEDFKRACLVHQNNHQNKRIDPWRINGVRDLTDQQVAILHELCKFRDQKAQELDRPLFKVISDKCLVNIAIVSPGTMKELERISCISTKQVNWIGKGLLTAVKRGLHKNPPSRPSRERRNFDYLERVDTLRAWRKATAIDYEVESDIVLPKDLLLTLAEKNPQNQNEMEKLLQTVPWRVEQYGDEIFNLLKAS
jgi:ribonuclease D